ncbi:DUF4142 domain-containing protein [Flavobacterium sp.]|uniref:DUF4142 domain-containing protein n=1 Tax=Flavobacterium sp. TaxID=239 RepID=UPI00286C811B|nr:DUF4142 domain-containing protein [Flavobacterium sp.]
MRHYILYRTTLQIFFAIVLILMMFSCNNSKKEEVQQPSVTEQNETKIDDTSKETDAQFLVKATEISLEEIKLGKLAQQIGSTKTVRDLGKMMETEHAKSLAEVTELAKTKMVTIPTAPPFDAEDAYNKLSAKSSVDFDKAYSDMMVNGHQETILLFEKTCNESQDTDIREWATKMLPALKMHLAQAQVAQKESDKNYR